MSEKITTGENKPVNEDLREFGKTVACVVIIALVWWLIFSNFTLSRQNAELNNTNIKVNDALVNSEAPMKKLETIISKRSQQVVKIEELNAHKIRNEISISKLQDENVSLSEGMRMVQEDVDISDRAVRCQRAVVARVRDNIWDCLNNDVNVNFPL